MEIDPAPPRPRTSTRDSAALRERLAAWLERRLPGARLTDFGAPSGNGMSSETLLFDYAVGDAADDTRARCVARLPPDAGAMPVFPDYDLEKQARAMRLVGARSTVPVPRVLWLECDAAPLGAPFLVMERVEGEAVPDVPPYVFDSWLLRAGPAQRRHLEERSIAVLAGVHAIELDAAERAALGLSARGESPLRRHVEAQRAYYRWVSSDGVRQPLIERGFDWLERHWPDNADEQRLSWGDARIGNILFRDFEPAAVLDWEMVATGPREIDLGWMIYLHHFFQDLTPLVGLPGIPDMMRLDVACAGYEAASSHRPRSMEFYTLYAALRHAIVMARIGRRGVHFGESAMPADPDDLIMHRHALEAMMEGRYWASRR